MNAPQRQPVRRGALRALATQPGASQPAAPMPASWQLYLPNVAYDAQDRRALLVDDLLRALPPGHGVLARSRLLSSYRELCLVGRIGESLAVRPPRD